MGGPFGSRHGAQRLCRPCGAAGQSNEFRAEAREIVEGEDASFAGVLPDRRPDREQLEVGYVVITRGRREDAPFTLPFFSIVNLRAAAQRLQAIGFRVSNRGGPRRRTSR